MMRFSGLLLLLYTLAHPATSCIGPFAFNENFTFPNQNDIFSRYFLRFICSLLQSVKKIAKYMINYCYINLQFKKMSWKNIKHWEILSEDISLKLYKLTLVELKFSVMAETIICKTYSSPESKILFYRPCMKSKLFSTIFLIQDLGHNYFQNLSAGFFLDHPTDINERKRGNTKCGVMAWGRLGASYLS